MANLVFNSVTLCTALNSETHTATEQTADAEVVEHRFYNTRGREITITGEEQTSQSSKVVTVTGKLIKSSIANVVAVGTQIETWKKARTKATLVCNLGTYTDMRITGGSVTNIKRGMTDYKGEISLTFEQFQTIT